MSHPLLGVFARLAMGVCAVEKVQAIVCLNDVYEGCWLNRNGYGDTNIDAGYVSGG